MRRSKVHAMPDSGWHFEDIDQRCFRSAEGSYAAGPTLDRDFVVTTQNHNVDPSVGDISPQCAQQVILGLNVAIADSDYGITALERAC